MPISKSMPPLLIAKADAMVSRHELKPYFDKARRFDQDRMIQVERSARIAWSIAIVAGVLAGASIFAVAALTPLKTVEPFVVRVDNSTGIVDVVSALTSTGGTYDEAVTKYFAAKYVRAREGYIRSEAEQNFRTVALLSTQPEQTRYSAFHRGGNPESPQNTYGRGATARVNIASISLINPNVVSVRYMRTITRGEEVRTTHWVAMLTFSYVNAPMSSTDRLVNPLGFAVSEYRADPETIN
ncbi:type IV secretion system protein VirB8 [Mesorhizobium sp. YR577]|nr:type IV secretion system protein VirB8 [Mesorhizobium sp. YR577]